MAYLTIIFFYICTVFIFCWYSINLKFFIFILIFVFDPMAVCLIIAYNKSLEQNKTGVEKIFDKYKSKVKVVKSKKKIVPNKKKEIVIKEVDENNEKNLSSPKGGIKPSS